ncbi:sugar ABC transporter substrate-binding protein [Solimicrobium silvestre]|uniref:Bacterial extracellular solute-binding protein n=1 Tax=Solimicrobium silvestre TaxID=2099400 RepID=A0A2S9H3U3_9BURK|nr:sugar ABC transporter substrate-binding protein [Solimicrobium silvestre]PRC94655.1 Bacterial extracellular solute-binding protein [Solimicrobium silvestre]
MKTSSFKPSYLASTLLLATTLGMASQSAMATELNIWIMSTTTQQQQDMKELLRPYLAKNPNLRVNVTVLNWESAWSKITAAAASGQGPDLLELGTTWVAAISSMGALEPLSAQQQNEVGGAKAFFPAVWGSTHRYDDTKIYALPWYADARAAFYRTDVFKKAGINPKDAFTNWGSFKQAMQKINGQMVDGKKIAALGYPGKNDWNVVHNLAPWIWNAGGDLLTADKKHSAINSPEALQAITYYTSFAAEGLVPSSALEKDSSQIESGFFNGQYAVIFTGSWILRQLNTPKAKGGQMDSVAAHNFGVESYPAGLKGNQTFFSGSDLAIMKSSKNKDEAWKLLSFMTSREAEVNYSKMSGMLPARQDAANDPTLMADPHYAEFIAQVKNGRHYPSVAGWGPLESVYLKNIGNMFDIVAGVKGKYTPQAIKQALDVTANEANDVLDESR